MKTHNIRNYSIKMFAAGFVSGALTVGGLVGMATAHADPNTTYFECLNLHGWSVANANDAVDVGVRVQNDIKRGMPNDQIEYNLIHNFGVTPTEASAITVCALDTLLS